MHALSALSNLAAFIQESLGEWVEVIYSASDSTIAISWSIYEKTKLMVFQRLQVANITKRSNFDDFEQADHVKKVAEVENESNYLYSPLKRTFRSVVRINAYVILACRKFKRKLFLVKHKEVKSLVTVLLPNN